MEFFPFWEKYTLIPFLTGIAELHHGSERKSNAASLGRGKAGVRFSLTLSLKPPHFPLYLE